ncbi:MAG: VCBS repeat-containing protein [Cyclobacteriaceae bacterium]|nr:VCBS repeat-containing protein [Cyclobacteriaceae bacterium]
MRSKVKIIAFWGACMLALHACKQPSQLEPLFNSLPSSVTGITFTNPLRNDFEFNILDYNNYFNGGGVGIGDFNLDGLPDIYFSANMVSGKLYLNRGDMRFEDVTHTAGLHTSQWASGVAIADINQDGLPDIYLSCSGYPDSLSRKNLLFIHQGMDAQGIPTFKEQARAYHLDDAGYTTQTAFFDYDKDGDLDAYLLTSYHDDKYRYFAKPKDTTQLHPSTDRLYRNDDGKFSLVSLSAGIVHEGYGLGMVVTDFNFDGWPDIYTSNDFIYEDRIYINNQDGTFTDHSKDFLAHQSLSSMGMDIADFNNDLLLDIFVLDMQPSTIRERK